VEELVSSRVMPLSRNWASAWMNQVFGLSTHSAGSLTATAASVAACGGEVKSESEDPSLPDPEAMVQPQKMKNHVGAPLVGFTLTYVASGEHVRVAAREGQG